MHQALVVYSSCGPRRWNPLMMAMTRGFAARMEEAEDVAQAKVPTASACQHVSCVATGLRRVFLIPDVLALRRSVLIGGT